MLCIANVNEESRSLTVIKMEKWFEKVSSIIVKKKFLTRKFSTIAIVHKISKFLKFLNQTSRKEVERSDDYESKERTHHRDKNCPDEECTRHSLAQGSGSACNTAWGGERNCSGCSARVLGGSACIFAVSPAYPEEKENICSASSKVESMINCDDRRRILEIKRRSISIDGRENVAGAEYRLGEERCCQF